MGPIYHRIHLGLGISHELPWQNVSVTNSLFSGPFFYPKRSPGQNVDLGSQNVFPCFLKKVWNWAGACPYPSAPSKVSMFVKILTTGSLYMSIWGPKTIFNPTKWANPGLGLFKIFKPCRRWAGASGGFIFSKQDSPLWNQELPFFNTGFPFLRSGFGP